MKERGKDAERKATDYTDFTDGIGAQGLFHADNGGLPRASGMLAETIDRRCKGREN